MTDTITIFDPQIERQIRLEANAANLRLGENTNLAELHEKLVAKGRILKAGENGLTCEGNIVSAKDVLIQASRDSDTRDYFVCPGSKLTALSELSSDPKEALRQKVEFINKYGEEAFGKMSLAAARMRPEVRVHLGMTQSEWNSLTTKEKSQAITLWGDGAEGIVGRILARRAK